MAQNPNGSCVQHWWCGLTLLVLVTGLASGCMVTGTIRGQVLDAQTGQPIPGAIALAVWTTREGFPGQYSTRLLGVQEAETDAQGRFTLERPASGIYQGLESVTVYKFGYVAWNNELIFAPEHRRENTNVPAQIQLDAFPSDGNRRAHMRFIDSSTSSSLSAGSWIKFQQAIRQEERMR